MNNCCFGNDRIVCGVLNVDQCKGKACSFHMTQAERKLSLNACDQRLRELPTDLQGCIADKYYQGKRAWHRPRSQTF